MICNNLSINEKGHLCIGGQDTVELAKQYGTPLYVMDEETVRKNCRTYKEALKKYYGENSQVLYASKACSFKQIYRIIAEEGIGADVVSPGELYTAKEAGIPLDKVYFHGNNKTDADIRFGIECGVGCFVADNREELTSIEVIAAELGKDKIKVMLRITPGIDPHTHKAVVTGNIDSKFGSAIATGQAREMVQYALSLSHVDLCGIHCHIGSQIFESTPFQDAARNMVGFMAEVQRETGHVFRELNLGGGFGVPYTEDDGPVDYDKEIGAVASCVKGLCAEQGLSVPMILMEPGRSIVADAGITLYTVGSVKAIPGFKSYVSVDGGMPDNPRYALYQSQYSAVIANRPEEKKTLSCTIAGRCCESGDLLAENTAVQPCCRGDILAVQVTGAYNFSMASNYNRIPRPPVVMVKDGKSYVAVGRESYADLVARDR